MNLDNAIATCELVKYAITDTTEEAIEECAIECEADYSVASTQYKGDRNVRVRTEKNRNGGRDVIAEGQAVAFLEFGAGVTYEAHYPIDKPAGIVGIGEYGKGKGKNPKWTFQYNGKFMTTSGNPPFMCLYNCGQNALRRIVEKIKEVLE